MADSSFMGLPLYAGGPDMTYTGVMPPRQGAQDYDEPSIPDTHQTAPGPIPLICYACPNNSKFSDISHLLTHVSSKGHLARLYNLEIQSINDLRARDTVRRFKVWKDTYKIDHLVLQRMEARDERGIQTQSRSQTPASTVPPDRRGKQPRGGSQGGRGGGRRGRTNPSARGGRSRQVHEIKNESDDEDEVGNGHDASKNSWNGNSNPLMPAGGDMDASHQTDLEGYASEAGSSLVPTEGDNETGPGPSLKGMYFDGMGIFDAAPEEERRKRNQRKPIAAHHKLQINSELVTTDENVFDTNLTHQRTRDVYDEASDYESEDEEQAQEVTKKRKRRSQARPAAATKKSSRRPDTPSRDGTPTLRVTRASAQSLGLMQGRTLSTGGRTTRSTVNRSPVQQLLHNHGFQEQAAMFQGDVDGQNDLGWTPPFQPRAPFMNQVPADTLQQVPTGSLQQVPAGTLQPSQHMQYYENSLHFKPAQSPESESVQSLGSSQTHESVQSFDSVQPVDPVQPYNFYQPEHSLQAFPSFPLPPSDPNNLFLQSNYNLSAGNIPANATAQILPAILPDAGDRSKSTSITDELTYQGMGLTSRDRLPGLAALRPGNPNISLASSSLGFKRDPAPAQFSGKENGGLTLKPTATSSNPYLQSTDSIQGETYNPLFVESQARDALGYRTYPSSTAGFQPINGRGTGEFDSLQMPSHHDGQAELWEIPDEREQQASSHHNASYHSTQANDEGFSF